LRNSGVKRIPILFIGQTN